MAAVNWHTSSSDGPHILQANEMKTASVISHIAVLFNVQ